MKNIFTNKNKNRILALSMCLCLLCLILTPAEALAKKTSNSKTVRIGWYHSALFQEGTSDEENKGGYSYEYIQEISKYTGWKYEYVYGDWSELIDKLEAGEIDALAGVSKTDERLDKFLYPNDIMGNERYALYQREDDTSMDTSDMSTFSGKKIGAIKNNLMTTYLEQWVDDKGADAKIVYYSGFEECDEDFKNGTIDAIVRTDNGIEKDSGYRQVTQVGKESYYLAISKSRDDLLSDINKAQSYIQDTDPCFISNLENEYYGNNLANSDLSEIELEWLKNHNKITVGYLENYIPYCGTDEKGNPRGLMVDVLEEMFKTLDIADSVTVQYKAYSDGEDMYEDLKDGKIDVAFPVEGESYLLEQRGIMASNEVITSSVNLVFKGEYNEEDIKNIAVTSGNTLMRDRLERAYPDAKFKEYSTIYDCLDAVLEGKVDATTINSLRADIVKNNRRYSNLSLMKLTETSGRCFGVASGNTVLLMILNHGINLIGPDFAINASYDYTSELYSFTWLDFLEKYLRVFVALGLIAVITIIVIIVETQKKNKSLSRQVDIIGGLANAYFTCFSVKLDTFDFSEIKEDQDVRQFILDASQPGQDIKEAIIQAISEEYRQEFAEFIDRASIQKRMIDTDVVSMEYRCLVPGREWCRASWIVVTRDEYLTPIELLFGVEDVSDSIRQRKQYEADLKLARDEAQSANNAKTRFLFNMSHDIRTPMNAILGYVGLLERKQLDQATQKDYLSKIKTSGQFLLGLINNVLEMARIESGKSRLEELAFKPGNVIAELQSIYSEFMKEKNISFTRTTDIHCDYIYGDEVKLREIFLNIIDNAYKYTPEGGSVSVSTVQLEDDRPDYIKLKTVISDTGIGMSEEYLPAIFEDFTRERNLTETKIHGSGLGMPIVKKLVELMGGTITVESEIGVGTTFTVVIPHRIASGIEKENTQEDFNNIEGFQGKRLLLVEDNELNAEIATVILKDLGFIVDYAEDGDICLDILEKDDHPDYDAVLMDIQMPKMNGYETTIAIRNMTDSTVNNLPIIAMTANAFEEDKQDAIDAGMNGHIAKPIVLTELVETISKALELKA